RPDFGLLADPTPHPSRWYARWKELPEDRRNALRTYTPAAIRPAAGEIDVDVFLHEPAGPASAWALNCAPGDELVLTGPDARAGYTGYGIHYTPPRTPGRLLLVGDASALPAMRNILAALRSGVRADVFLELADSADNTLGPSARGVLVHVVEQDAAGVAGDALERAVREWGAGEGSDLADH